MNRYPYQLETYKGSSTRYHCPQCRQKSFVRYLNVQTGKHINSTVGRCNHEASCGYHYSPKQYFQDNKLTITSTKHTGYTKSNQTTAQLPSYISIEVFNASLRGYRDNCFVQYLHTLFDADTVHKLIATYHIGTSKHWKGATVFWQVDRDNNIRTGKVMLYNPATGKRVKEPYSHITWTHKLLNQPDFNLKQCLFGEHLLNESSKPIAIVESEKTAIIASVYEPSFVWLAVGSLSNLTAEKCSVLKGREAYLFPDLNGYEKWNKKMLELPNSSSFRIFNLPEQLVTDEERQQGLDIADYFIRHSHDTYTNSEPEEQSLLDDDFDDTVWAEVPWEKENPTSIRLIKQEDWSDEITDVEAFFEGIGSIDEPIRLNRHTTILNVKHFVEGNLATVKANNGKPCFKVYLDYLRELREYLQQHIKLVVE